MVVLLFFDDYVALKTVLLPRDLERDFDLLWDWWIDLLKESTLLDLVADFFFTDFDFFKFLIDLFELVTDLFE